MIVDLKKMTMVTLQGAGPVGLTFPDLFGAMANVFMTQLMDEINDQVEKGNVAIAIRPGPKKDMGDPLKMVHYVYDVTVAPKKKA